MPAPVEHLIFLIHPCCYEPVEAERIEREGLRLFLEREEEVKARWLADLAARGAGHPLRAARGAGVPEGCGGRVPRGGGSPAAAEPLPRERRSGRVLPPPAGRAAGAPAPPRSHPRPGGGDLRVVGRVLRGLRARVRRRLRPSPGTAAGAADALRDDRVRLPLPAPGAAPGEPGPARERRRGLALRVPRRHRRRHLPAAPHARSGWTAGACG